MTKRIPVQTITVVREGKNFIPPIGKPFDFTDEEMADIEKLNPAAVREAVNEDPADPPAEKKAAKGKKDPEGDGKKDPEGDGL